MTHRKAREYKKLLEEKQQGREEDYQQGMEHLLEQLTAEYHKRVQDTDKNYQ